MLNFTVCAFTTLLFYPSLDANKPVQRGGQEGMIAFLSHSLFLFKVNYFTLKINRIGSISGKPFIFLWKCKANIRPLVLLESKSMKLSTC